jgi:hypothetical protein
MTGNKIRESPIQRIQRRSFDLRFLIILLLILPELVFLLSTSLIAKLYHHHIIMDRKKLGSKFFSTGRAGRNAE